MKNVITLIAISMFSTTVMAEPKLMGFTCTLTTEAPVQLESESKPLVSTEDVPKEVTSEPTKAPEPTKGDVISHSKLDVKTSTVPSLDNYGLPRLPVVDSSDPTKVIVPTANSVKSGNGPAEVSVEKLDEPHKDLTGTDLLVWNQYCRGRKPAEVGEWRYNRCNGLDAEFTK